MKRVVALLAVGAGLSAASLYYNQPMLSTLARDLGATPERVGFIPTMTQLGYAAGLVLFAPLGDTRDRRRVVVVKALALAAALALAGAARDALWLSIASLAIGFLATVAQDLVPAAAALSEPHERGKTVGTVMTGLLLGILLSRFASGAVTAWLSWRFVFFGASGLAAGFAIVAARVLPPFPPLVNAPYVRLLRSMLALFRDVPALRLAAIAQGLLSVTFSGFWSTLALGLAAPPFSMSSFVAGSFGIAGAAGAIAAPIAGSIADKRGPETVIRIGALLTIASFVVMAIFGHSIVVLVVGTIVFDLGVQSCLISHQTIVYAQDPAARSRLNAVLVSTMFLGMSSGAFLANRIFVRFGFGGVCVMGAAFATAALLVRLRAKT